MKTFLVLPLLFLACLAYGQSSTYEAWLKMSHNVDNNQYRLKKENVAAEELYWANVFFNYYKSRKPSGAIYGGEQMVFSVGYEYLIQKRVTKKGGMAFSFPVTTQDDKLLNIKVSVIDPATQKESKLKTKLITTNLTRSALEVAIDTEAMPEGSLVKLYCEIESFGFERLRCAIAPADANTFLTFNVPAIFTYRMYTANLSKGEESTHSFRLKQFTYQNPPIVDYYVESTSTKWQVVSADVREIDFELLSIKLPVDLGAGVEQILKHAKLERRAGAAK